MDRLKGNVAFITGGARGQGRAMALKFASEGADVVICDICSDAETVPYPLSTSADLAETRSRVEALGRRCVAEVADVRSQEQLDRVVERGIDELGHIDIVCASAGVHSFLPFWEMPEEMWQEVIDTNLTGVWHTVKAVAPHMIERGEGAAILTSSVMGKETGPDLAHYAAAKHGVIGLMRSFAFELGPHNIRVNAILPSVVHDKMGDNPATREWVFGRSDATTEDYVAATRNWHVLRGRAALPAAAIADAALFFASAESQHITGTELVVDAGHSILPGFNHTPIHDERIAVGPYPNDGVTVG
ncbi:mycofactocin-coupled SDR family oxidoreductase [Conexibacter sp. CPCC 206217]|uniref:mycofactocin-coupled SDR family oxidoreductase n=1 Tax=Conexibacter sp. CPCC 206217 TaxID=3064574 RepID=UPI002721406C|nr:mycofactocin-coupled SDR family oxidoreductase [Conexibacter sp. CPCC 206217]MDO8210182.1 mycofactocin-coupled SDR family oxidoreductase [Conexibacter sp. CPCC 206217]